MLHIYTDGSSKGNPGPAGYGVIIMSEDEKTVLEILSGTADCATNNAMELTAIIKAIEYVIETKEKAIIYTDSSYCEKSINEWMQNWYLNNWKNSKNKTIENLELISTIHSYYSKNFIHWQVEKIKGHAGHIGNELADAAATQDKAKLEKFLLKL